MMTLDVGKTEHDISISTDPTSRIGSIITRNIGLRKRKLCSKKLMKKRLPVLQWLPSYNTSKLAQDVLAGVTVGITAVAQGIAYAVIAGLPPEHGLYSGIMGGIVYTIFGACKNMSIGPTAILSALVGKYVNGLSPDFAILVTFLAGIVQLSLAVLRLGFLVEFLSGPVITGFVTAAVVQIISSQMKPLFGTAGNSGDSFAGSVYHFTLNIRTVRLGDTVLGVATIAVLILLKWLGIGCTRNGGILKKLRWFVSLARNAVVVSLAMIVTYLAHIYLNDDNMITIVGKIHGGLPEVKIPPFSTTVGNETMEFTEMLNCLGGKVIVLPFVAILEIVVVSKAFEVQGSNFDAMQEIVALGISNVLGSFIGGMPVTASISRSAILQSSGVQTTFAGTVVSCIVIISLSLLTSMFYLIPKSTLAGMIIIAVAALADFEDISNLWSNSKREFAVFALTMLAGLGLGLEYGVIVGVSIELIIIMYKSARPAINHNVVMLGGRDVAIVPLPERASYSSSEYIRRKIIRIMRASTTGTIIIIDGTSMQSMDTTVAHNIISTLDTVELNGYQIVCLNFTPELRKMCLSKSSAHESKFVYGVTVQKLLQQGFVDIV